MAVIKLFLQRYNSTSNIYSNVVKTCRRHKSWGKGRGSRKNYLRIRGQYSRRSNPSAIIIFHRKGDPFRFPPYDMIPGEGRRGALHVLNKGFSMVLATKRSGAPLTYYSRQRKGCPTLWTILVEILQDPKTGSHRVLCRI